jgi:cytochrome c-type biogenesis protein CcmH
MILWGVICALSLLAIAYVMRPLVAQREDASRASSSLGVYRSQLSEVDADLARGIISASEADAARLEIKRRILHAGQLSEVTQATRLPLPVMIAGGGLCLALSIGLYLHLGRPSLPGQPYSLRTEQTAVANAVTSELEAMIAKLQSHLDANPGDIEGLKAMGWAQMRVGAPDKAVAALRQAATLAPKDVQVLATYGELLVDIARGKVSDEASGLFERVLALDASDPRGRYYRALRQSQTGEETAALDGWIALINDSPKDAEWLPQVRAQAQALALKLKRDPKVVP